MKFIVSSAQLLKQLQSISGVLNSTNTLPILDNFLFEIRSNTLKISASDLETTMKTTVLNAEADEDGSIAIPAKLLLDTLKTFSDQPLTFLIDNSTFGIEIGSENGKFKLAGQNGEEFPKTPKMEASSSTTMNADVLSSAINKTLFATGNDELRPIMSGVFCELSSEGCTFVSTDAHKLVKYKRKDASAENTVSFILPKKPLTLLKNTLSNGSEVSIEYNQTNAFFKFDNIELVCRLIDGKYPNYEAVIPKENPNVLSIDRIEFYNSIRRVGIFASKSTHQIRLKIAGTELHISSEDLDFSNEAFERLSCQYSGEDIEIGFNSKFLLEMLNNLDSEQINLEMSAPNRAGIIIPQDGVSENEDVLMLVMPVMLNQ
ncbi:MAG: DNA polymerase III subunit beta [Flavobacteriales bacterium]